MKAIITIIVLLVIVGGAYMLMTRDNDPLVPVQTPPVTQPQVQEATTTPSVQEFTVVAKNFTFSPTTMRVKKGNTVKVTLQNQGGTHDWVLDATNTPRTRILQNGQTQTIEFIATSTGSFEYYCSVGTHRQMGMIGTLIVE